MYDPNDGHIRHQIHDHMNEIARLLSGDENMMVMKFVSSMETMDKDGEFGVWTCVNEGALCHQTLGLAAATVARETEHIAQGERDHS